MAMHLARVMPTQRDQRLDGPHPLHEDNDATWLNDLMRHQQIISHDIRGRDAEKVSHDWQASGPRRENTIPARRAAGRQRSSAGLQICPAWHRGGMCVLWRLRKTGCTQRAGPRIPMSAQAGPNNVVDIVVLQT